MTSAKLRPLGLPIAAVLTGVTAGLAGVALTYLLHGIQHLAFGYTENTFLVGVEKASNARRVLALAIGGFIAGLAWWIFRRRAGDGVEQAISVRDAARTGRRMPLGSALIDGTIQIFAVAVGGSLGREGAPRRIGAALGGELAHRFGLKQRERKIILAAGAGAGLAAVYHVPLTGAAFTIEVMLAGAGLAIGLDMILVALTTSLLATSVAGAVLGDKPVYSLPGATHVTLWLCVAALLVGLLSGVAGQALLRLTRIAREQAAREEHQRRMVITTTLAFTVLGIVAIPAPDILGNGKALAQLAFDGSLSAGAALALTLLKPAATAMCMRSGATGGILTPAFATGATLGLAMGGFTHSASDVRVALVLAGAAAVTASSQKAPITAILFAAELTTTYGEVGVGRGVAILLAVLAAVVTMRASTYMQKVAAVTKNPIGQSVS